MKDAAPARPAAPESSSSAVGSPPRLDVALMTVAVLAVSTSGPIIAATAAPALAIAFWRNGLATLLIAPIALGRHVGELRSLSRREWALAGCAGALLALHFATWVPSLGLTTVASSTALVCTQSAWVAVIARVRGARVSTRVWLGVALSTVGAVTVTGVDVSLSARALAGDLLALAGGVFAAAYITVGAAVRRNVSTTTYTLVCYGTCSLLLLILCAASGQRLSGYDAHTWFQLAALTVGAQLLGHSLFNRVLRATSATVVSLATLLEVPGATLIAAVALGQLPPAAAFPGLVLLLGGIAVVISARDRPAWTPQPAIPAE